ncbi:MAG: YbjN domain-containing protein [Gemmatimonadetes bacterium]|nr:YbjN domain-containing protein [Gemmatimonadota bacterium]
MITREDLESFLIRMDAEFDEVDEGMFLVRSENGSAPIVVHHSEPVLVVRMKLMDLPEGNDGLGPLYEALLRLNATDVVHGAYGLEERELILTDTLQLGTLDFEELRASLESVQMAASSHLSEIRALAGAGGSD